MNNEKIKNLLFERIIEYQVISGCIKPDLDLEIKPYLHLEGFDSLRASEITSDLSEELDIKYETLKKIILTPDKAEEVTIKDIIKGIKDIK